MADFPEGASFGSTDFTYQFHLTEHARPLKLKRLTVSVMELLMPVAKVEAAPVGGIELLPRMC